ncbi:MAG: hypothetical protein GY797_39430 [Deltaproteobacteria bacterium]|nr:hypothetical protein [Deltaproteobacteria bacterium]
MSYKTRPYISNTFGIVGNPFTYYEVTQDRKLYKHRRVLNLFNWAAKDTLNLNGASANIVNQKFVKGLVSLGDVEVSVPGKTRIFQNIRGVKSFMLAVEGEHPDVHSTPPPGPLWHEGLGEKDLEDYVICLPYVGATLNKVLWQMRPSKENHPQFIKEKGDWAKKGDVIAAMPSLISPVDGKITFTGYHEEMCIWEKDADWPRNPSYGSDDERKRTTKVKIRPVKGAQTSANLVAEAYGNTISLIEKSLPPKRGTALMIYKNRTPAEEWEQYMRRVSDALEILKNAEHKTLPVNPSASGPHDTLEV